MTASTEIVMTAKTFLPTAKFFGLPNIGAKPGISLAAFGFLALCLCFPDIAAASGGITEFSSPLERVVNTITGPAGKWISIVAMALCGVIFIMNKNENYTFLLSTKAYFIQYYH